MISAQQPHCTAMASSSNPGTLQELVLDHIAIDSRGTGGNVKSTCRHCNKTFTGSLTRQVAHITGRTGSGVAVCKELGEETAAAIQLHVQRLERDEDFYDGCESE